MRIGIDLRFLGVDRRGMGRYVQALARCLLGRQGAHDFVLLAEPRSAEAAERLGAGARCGCRVVTASAFSQARLDVCWFPWSRADVRVQATATVATLHDLVPLVYPAPGVLRALDRRHDMRRIEQVVARASVLVVSSAFIGDEVTTRMRIDRARVAVVHDGVDPVWFAASGAQGPGTPARLPRWGPRLKTPGLQRDGTESFVLWVGSDEERKNLGTLLRAFGRVRAGGWPGRLVLCGDNPDLLARHARTIEECGLAGSVVVEGYLDDEALRRRYREAALFVFPSLYEGFGLPVLEAMASGTPVACARAASLPEVAGDAAEYFDPRDAEDMARAMRRCLDDDAHARHLAALGRQRAAGFTWDAAADRLLDVFERAAARPA